MSNTTSLIEAINLIRATVKPVATSKVPELRYRFLSENKILEVLRDPMIEAGVIVMPAGVEIIRCETGTTAKGNPNQHIVGLFTYRLVHVFTGQELFVTVLGEGMDVGDKAANKAMTGALKYALRQTFLLEGEDDPDATSSDHYGGRSSPAAAQGSFVPGPWTGDKRVLNKFWAKVNELGLSNDEAHSALGVQSVKDYAGTKEQARAALEDYASRKAAA